MRPALRWPNSKSNFPKDFFSAFSPDFASCAINSCDDNFGWKENKRMEPSNQIVWKSRQLLCQLYCHKCIWYVTLSQTLLYKGVKGDDIGCRKVMVSYEEWRVADKRYTLSSDRIINYYFISCLVLSCDQSLIPPTYGESYWL